MLNLITPHFSVGLEIAFPKEGALGDGPHVRPAPLACDVAGCTSVP